VRGATAAAGLILALCGLLAASAAAEPPPRERELYLLHCSGCHGADGRGAAGVAPSLHGLARLAESADGRSYLARVPGVAQAPVDDDDLAALLNWVLAEFSQPPLAQPYSAEEIGALRQNPLRDPARARPAAGR
jgi:mono/diheme cytochrome c family protein